MSNAIPSLIFLSLSILFIPYASADLIAHYTFDDNTGTDSSGYGNHMTPGGSPSLVDGIAGNASNLYFGDFFNTSTIEEINSVDHFSVGGWVKLDAIDSEQVYLSTQGFGEYGWLLYFNGETYTFEVSNEEETVTAESTHTIEPGRWYHIFGTYDGYNITLYVNGSLSEEYQGCSGPTLATDCDFMIGGWCHDPYSLTGLNGSVDDFRVYNETLTAAEVEALYLSADNESPVITILQPNESLYDAYAEPLFLEVSADEEISEWWFSVDGGVNNTFMPGVENTPYWPGQVFIYGINHGENMLAVYAEDMFGNIGSATKIFTVDRVEPFPIIHEPQHTIYHTTEIPLYVSDISGDDEASEWYYSLDGGDMVLFVPNTTVIVPDEPDFHTIEVHAYDAAGNHKSSVSPEFAYSPSPDSEPASMTLKTTGEFDYLEAEDIRIRMHALVKDDFTGLPVSDANVSIEIYRNGRLGESIITDVMVEEIPESGIYSWRSGGTIMNNTGRWSKGIYLVRVTASKDSAAIATDILSFHIDPPGGSDADSIPMILATLAICVSTGAALSWKIHGK